MVTIKRLHHLREYINVFNINELQFLQVKISASLKANWFRLDQVKLRRFRLIFFNIRRKYLKLKCIKKLVNENIQKSPTNPSGAIPYGDQTDFR